MMIHIFDPTSNLLTNHYQQPSHQLEMHSQTTIMLKRDVAFYLGQGALQEQTMNCTVNTLVRNHSHRGYRQSKPIKVHSQPSTPTRVLQWDKTNRCPKATLPTCFHLIFELAPRHQIAEVRTEPSCMPARRESRTAGGPSCSQGSF